MSWGEGERGAGCLGAAQFRGRDCRVSKKPGQGPGPCSPGPAAVLGGGLCRDQRLRKTHTCLRRCGKATLCSAPMLSCVPKDQMRLSKCRALGVPWWP